MLQSPCHGECAATQPQFVRQPIPDWDHDLDEAQVGQAGSGRRRPASALRCPRTANGPCRVRHPEHRGRSSLAAVCVCEIVG